MITVGPTTYIFCPSVAHPEICENCGSTMGDHHGNHPGVPTACSRHALERAGKVPPTPMKFSQVNDPNSFEPKGMNVHELHASPTPETHRYVGMWRPTFDAAIAQCKMPNIGYRCPCGGSGGLTEWVMEHWLAGHFDVPQYEAKPISKAAEPTLGYEEWHEANPHRAIDKTPPITKAQMLAQMEMIPDDAVIDSWRVMQRRPAQPSVWGHSTTPGELGGPPRLPTVQECLTEAALLCLDELQAFFGEETVGKFSENMQATWDTAAIDQGWRLIEQARGILKRIRLYCPPNLRPSGLSDGDRQLIDDSILLGDLMSVIREAFPASPELARQDVNFAEKAKALFKRITSYTQVPCFCPTCEAAKAKDQSISPPPADRPASPPHPSRPA
ncbi:MAG TPA: hypothetical protein VNH18_06465 [Bryobacteraceae bacterium]|nr:hypothetical protein [Bryobacteraceae bacterium]